MDVDGDLITGDPGVACGQRELTASVCRYVCTYLFIRSFHEVTITAQSGTSITSLKHMKRQCHNHKQFSNCHTNSQQTATFALVVLSSADAVRAAIGRQNWSHVSAVRVSRRWPYMRRAAASQNRGNSRTAVPAGVFCFPTTVGGDFSTSLVSSLV